MIRRCPWFLIIPTQKDVRKKRRTCLTSYFHPGVDSRNPERKTVSAVSRFSIKKRHVPSFSISFLFPAKFSRHFESGNGRRRSNCGRCCRTRPAGPAGSRSEEAAPSRGWDPRSGISRAVGRPPNTSLVHWKWNLLIRMWLSGENPGKEVVALSASWNIGCSIFQWILFN